MSYAIVEAGGVQLRVEPGRFYDLNHLHAEVDEKYTIDKVLLINHDGEITVGQPLIAEARVEGTILSHWRGRKVIVYKMQPKKKTRKKRGHRQELTRLMIDSISINGTVLAGTEGVSEDGEEVEATAVEEISAAAETIDVTPEAEESKTETVEASGEEE
ncbi:MAG: 50S ribosomal protein L21 [Cyanobacteriota bacterium]|nr:50S ribosomal protein L21 [Cyanobacteriota bacterium]